MNNQNVKKRVAIVDFGMGNVWSVASAIKYLGAEPVLVNEAKSLKGFRYVILPGVGSFYEAMLALRAKGFESMLRALVLDEGVNLLGICLGMQLIGASSTEDQMIEGLNLISNHVTAFDKEEVGSRKVPHVGFNSVVVDTDSSLFQTLPENPDFYFTHSYKMLGNAEESGMAMCNYGIDFVAGFDLGNICGTQFHPEKSQTNGLILLNNFLLKN